MDGALEIHAASREIKPATRIREGDEEDRPKSERETDTQIRQSACEKLHGRDEKKEGLLPCEQAPEDAGNLFISSRFQLVSQLLGECETPNFS